KSLESLRMLEILDVSHSQIKGPGLHALRYCKLRELNLSNTLLDDAGMKSVSEIGHHLQCLKLAYKKITDVGLEELKKYRPIVILDASNTRITGASLRSIPLSIRTLNLHGTDVCDQALARIADMPELADLDVGETKITDDSVSHFKEMAETQNRSYNRRQ